MVLPWIFPIPTVLSWLPCTMSQYQKGKTNLDYSEARDNEWQWHQLGHMQVCTSHQTDNHASTPPLSFLQAGCRSCRQANSVKALKALIPTVWRRRHIYIHSMAEKTSWHRWNEITSLSPYVFWDQQRNFCGVQRCKGAVAFIFSHSRLC